MALDLERPWADYLDLDDLRTLVTEVDDAVRRGDDLADLLRDWRTTAEHLADPVIRAALLGPFDPADYFVEVPRPPETPEGAQ